MKDRINQQVLNDIFPKRLKRTKASKQVHAQLKEMILAGKLKEGQRLIEEQVALSFDVSRTIVGNVFLKLKKEKLILKTLKKGAFVSYKS